jgi:hypothetical protein
VHGDRGSVIAIFRQMWAPEVSENVIRWFMFGVVFATLPIAANYLMAVTQSVAINWGVLLGQGELLLVSAGVTASAAGELQGAVPHVARRFRIVLSGLAYGHVFLSSLWFANIATSRVDQREIDEAAIARGSTIMFLFAVVTGASCVIVSKIGRS